MVGPGGLEPLTSSVSRKRSNQTELRAYRCSYSSGAPAGRQIAAGFSACAGTPRKGASLLNRFTSCIALADNRLMAKPRREARADAPAFGSGALVLVTLNNPREKFWGAILELTPAGVSVRGIDLNSFDDFAGQVKAGDPVSAGAVFFPMHRIERIELDAHNGEFPSLQERFEEKTGQGVAPLFGARPQPPARRQIPS